MSSQPEQVGIAAAVRAGLVTKFLPKPFDVDQLVQDVHDAVAAHASETRQAEGNGQRS
jgi:DNA-binding NtrC family response regulator